MFKKQDSSGYAQVLDKITRKTLVHGARTLMTEFRLAQGAVLPKHSHPHEQTGYLVSGHMDLAIGGKTHAVGPGDSWCIPGDTEHSALAHEDSVAVEVFCPVREDYLPQAATE
jgi:quercetin dioxygenase-like cupin family protein